MSGVYHPDSTRNAQQIKKSQRIGNHMIESSGGDMKTYRLRLIGRDDGLVYGVKEYEAADEMQAAELAGGLCGDRGDLWWGNQPLVQELIAAPAN